MEIKIQCECGSRYMFEIEPVHGRMPTPIKCPNCGADGTAQANEQIQQTLSGASPAPITGIPLSMADAPSPPPPGGGLRINRPPPPPPPPPGPSGGGYAPPPPMPSRGYTGGSFEKPKSVWPKVLIACAVVFCLCGGFVGVKLMKHLPKLTEFVSEMSKAGDKGDVLNLEYLEDTVVIFVRHTNDTEVAEACKAYWRDQLRKTLTVSPLTNLAAALEQSEGGTNEFQMLAPYNGYIRITGSSGWPAAEYEGLAQQLSRRLNTLVFEYSGIEDPRTEDFLYDEHFGVYGNGERKFHALIHLKMSLSDKFKVEKSAMTEGDDWAVANGFKPGDKGFKDFDISDADKITRHLGMKMWDEPVEEEVKGRLMTAR